MMKRIPLLVATLALAFPAAANAAYYQFLGSTSQGQAVKLRARANFARKPSAPWPLSHFLIGWRADCTSGANIGDGTTFAGLAFHPFPKFGGAASYTTAHVTYSAANGRTLSYAISFHLRGILPRNPFRGARGTWTANVQVRDTNQNVIDTCTTGLVSWYASLFAYYP